MRTFKLCKDLTDNLYKDELIDIAKALGLLNVSNISSSSDPSMTKKTFVNNSSISYFTKAQLCQLISDYVKGDYKLLEEKLANLKDIPGREGFFENDENPDNHDDDNESNNETETETPEQRYQSSSLPNVSNNMRWLTLTLNNPDFKDIFINGDLEMLKVLLKNRPDLRNIIVTKAFPFFIPFYTENQHLELAQTLYDNKFFENQILAKDLFVDKALNMIPDDTNYLAWVIATIGYPSQETINCFYASNALTRKPNVTKFLLDLKLWPDQDLIDRLLDYDTLKFFLGKGMKLSPTGVSNILIHGSEDLIALILELGYRPSQKDIDYVPLVSREDNDSIRIYELLKNYNLFPSSKVLRSLRDNFIRDRRQGHVIDERSALTDYLLASLKIVQDMKIGRTQEEEEEEETQKERKKEEKRKKKEDKRKAKKDRRNKNDDNDDDDDDINNDNYSDESSWSTDSEDDEFRRKQEKKAYYDANLGDDDRDSADWNKKQKNTNKQEEKQSQEQQKKRDWSRFFRNTSARGRGQGQGTRPSRPSGPRKPFETFEDYIEDEDYFADRGFGRQLSFSCMACAKKLEKQGLWPKVKGIYTTLSEDEIKQLKKAFRQWALVNHPDKTKGSHDLFQEISNCHDLFKDGKCI